MNTDCIQITASNVSLKLNGHQITNTAGGGSGIDVNPSGPPHVSHVAIQGPGLIPGFQNGIFFLDADYSQVDFVTAANNTYGIFGFNTTSLTVGSNVLVRNGQWGLVVGNSTSGTIQNNEASGNGAATAAGGTGGGIGLGGASNGNTVNNNTASGNGPQSGTPVVAAGIVISGNGNRVYGNTTDGNILAGIQIGSGGGNSIFSNISSVGNGKNDLEDDNPSCGTDSWSGNVFFTSNPSSCIH